MAALGATVGKRWDRARSTRCSSAVAVDCGWSMLFCGRVETSQKLSGAKSAGGAPDTLKKFGSRGSQLPEMDGHAEGKGVAKIEVSDLSI